MAKRTTRKKVTKKVAKKKVTKKQSQKKLPTRPSVKLPDGKFSEQACTRILAILYSKHELEVEEAELLEQRDVVRQGIVSDEKEIQNMADADNPKASVKQVQASYNKLIGLLKDRARRQKKYDKLTTSISEVRAKLRTQFDDLARIVAQEDDSGTLFEHLNIKDPSKAADEGDDKKAA